MARYRLLWVPNVESRSHSGTVFAAKSGAACGVQPLKEPSHRVVESQGTLRFILPDNKFAEDPNCLGLAGSTASVLT